MTKPTLDITGHFGPRPTCECCHALENGAVVVTVVLRPNDGMVWFFSKHGAILWIGKTKLHAGSQMGNLEAFGISGNWSHQKPLKFLDHPPKLKKNLGGLLVHSIFSIPIFQNDRRARPRFQSSRHTMEKLHQRGISLLHYRIPIEWPQQTALRAFWIDECVGLRVFLL